MKNVQEQVVNQALCTACGACAGICLTQAISMTENPGGFLAAKIETAKCVDCGRCLGVCPSVPQNQPLDNLDKCLHGTCLEGFIGYAMAKRIRREGQSGGIVTALLLYLLEIGEIDGAITNQFDWESRRSTAVYADSRQALLDSCGSYYTQSSVVKTVLEHGDKRLAAVVLGCQAEALELCCKKQPDARMPAYLIGLICAGQNSGHMIDGLIAQSGCPVEETPQSFRFRYSHPAYGGWPGNVLLVTNQHRYVLDKSKRHALKASCEAYRCLLCYDQMCIGADLVCGDPWGIEGDHSAGETVIIARTEKGRKLLRDAQAAGYIQLQSLSIEKIMAGETVYSQRLPTVASGFSICRQQQWCYPYGLTPAVQAQLERVVVKSKKAISLRMRYTHARNLAKTTEEVTALTAAYFHETVVHQRWQRWGLRLLFPIRCIRYVLRMLKNR